MRVPTRQRRQTGRHALVDGIPFELPVNSHDSPALMAGFSCDADAVARLLPGNELHPVRLPNGRGLFIVTVIDYRTTDIGAYVEYSIAFAVTKGERPNGLLRSVLMMGRSGTGQYVWDLPVSSLISVKGGKGIWGMPKHQANLDFRCDEREMSSQYDLNGQLCMRITVRRPKRVVVPLRNVGAVNWCAYRGMLMKSSIYFSDNAQVAVAPFAKAKLLIGGHPRMDPLRDLGISSYPVFTATLAHSHGILDDHFEAWFLTEDSPVAPGPADGEDTMRAVVDLPNSTDWLTPPDAAGRERSS